MGVIISTLIALTALASAGVLSAMSAAKISDKASKNDLKRAREWAIISSVVNFVGLVIALIIAIVLF